LEAGGGFLAGGFVKGGVVVRGGLWREFGEGNGTRNVVEVWTRRAGASWIWAKEMDRLDPAVAQGAEAKKSVGNPVIKTTMRKPWISSPVFSSIVAVLVAFALMTASAGGQSCTTTDADRATVADTVRTMYAGAVADDMAKIHSVVAPEFYAFDGGVDYPSIDALMAVVKAYQDQGAKFVWTVTKPMVTIHCNEAWISYVNDGSIQIGGSAPVPTQWLESAVLEKQSGVWKIVFFHSTRVAPAKPAQ